MVFSHNSSGKLTVELTGITSVKGKAYVALFREKDRFPEMGHQFVGKVLAVKGKTMTVELEGVPVGTYAVAAYHDNNGNGKLDRNLLGMPTEAYGFSNDARGVFSAPGFEDASFTFKHSRSIRITLR